MNCYHTNSFSQKDNLVFYSIKVDFGGSFTYMIGMDFTSMVLETYSLFELLEEAQLIPEKFLKDLSGTYTTIVNPDFLVWKSKEKTLLTFISSTLSPSILALTVGCATAKEVWKVLENRFLQSQGLTS